MRGIGIVGAAAAIMAGFFIPVSISGALAGDWAVLAGGCKVWNPHPAAGEAIRWTGGCKDGLIEGMGVLEWQRDGKTHERDEGQWRAGHQVNGSQIWPGGHYDGQFAESLPNGRGVLVLGGARYEGMFLNGKPNGMGTLTGASGVFEGNWTDGCFNGGKRRAAIGVPLQSCP